VSARRSRPAHACEEEEGERCAVWMALCEEEEEESHDDVTTTTTTTR
jgi:hypothetical protein